jgi:glycosyltransferase involved in cell wall biosynthesis
MSVKPHRILIVTSTYAPATIADMHRARHLAWTLPNCGWEVEILSPDASYQPPSCIDDDSAAYFVPAISVHYVSPFLPALFRAFRFSSIGWRALLPMFLGGVKLFQSKQFDLVYFSTTQFPLFLLGRIWKWWFCIPYVLDFHDPCYREDARVSVWMRLGWKHAISGWLAKKIESWSVAKAVGLVVVSPVYLDLLRRRYISANPSLFAPGRTAVIPFAALALDLEQSSRHVSSPEVKKRTAKIVYVGAGGPIMERAFSFLCKALARMRFKTPDLFVKVRIELYGTMLGWRRGEPQHMQDIALSYGVAEIVRENSNRVTFHRSMELLHESQGALLLGVDDLGYMPSKLATYALTGVPLLAVIRRGGAAFQVFTQHPNLADVIWFDESEEMPLDEASSILQRFFEEVFRGKTYDRRNMLEPLLASAMARRHAELFEACVTAPRELPNP